MTSEREHIICDQCGKREDFMWVDKFCLSCFDTIYGFRNTYLKLRDSLTSMLVSTERYLENSSPANRRELEATIRAAREVYSNAWRNIDLN